MIKCKKCEHYFEYDAGTDQIEINGHTSKIDKNEIMVEKNPFIYGLFFDLLSDIKNKKIPADYAQFKYELNTVAEITCPQCQENNNKYYSYSLANHFHWYLENYIAYVIQDITSKHFNLRLNEIGVRYSENFLAIVNVLPSKYKKEKEFLLRIKLVNSKLPLRGGKGGEDQFINWLIDHATTVLFGFVLTKLISFGFEKMKAVITDSAVKRKIRKDVLKNVNYWYEYDTEQLKKNFEFPKEFKGSKEEIIERIVLQKSIDLKNALIEKVRKETPNNKFKTYSLLSRFLLYLLSQRRALTRRAKSPPI